MATTPAVPSAAQDAAAARGILLRAGDLPGYSQASSSDPSEYASAYFACTRNPLVPGGRTARGADQGGFVIDETAAVRAVQTTYVVSFAAFATSEAEAKRAVADLAKPDVAACASKTLAAAANRLTSSATTAATVALPGMTAGDELVGIRTTLTGTTAVMQYFDLTVVRRGRALAFLFVSRLARSAVPETERQRLAGVLASRMA